MYQVCGRSVHKLCDNGRGHALTSGMRGRFVSFNVVLNIQTDTEHLDPWIFISCIKKTQGACIK